MPNWYFLPQFDGIMMIRKKQTVPELGRERDLKKPLKEMASEKYELEREKQAHATNKGESFFCKERKKILTFWN